MSLENNVKMIGKVVKGPFPYATEAGKTRTRYQVELLNKPDNKFPSAKPFVISRGVRAELDLENLKTGDLVFVDGKISTRFDQEKKYLILNTKNNELEEKELDLIEEDDVYYVYVQKTLITEIVADDVFYASNFFVNLTPEQRNSFMSVNNFKKALKQLEEEKKQ